MRQFDPDSLPADLRGINPLEKIYLFAAQLRISIPDATNACRRLVKDDERYATTLAGFHVIALVGYMSKHATQMIQCA
ncbi:hypothetical protein AAC691_07245 [Nguyenibacter vanlangensis]|uniref:Uncharacterized protein n=1 Tax=Nguyenibacter vanlangensis TaxID=1216886 RepID=A0ABZ3D951_9PROT